MTEAGTPATGDDARETLVSQPAGNADLLGGRYRLREVIGRGGMAEVYRADDVRLARLVAVKILLDSAGDETDRERFIAEAKTLAMLSHSGLVTVLDAGFGSSGPQRAVAGQENDRPFLVMDLVDGPTWAELMRNGPMSLDDLAPIATQVAEALAYVHARGVVHRDVKPGNVLIGSDDTVKLADFGIARLVEQRSHHTRTGVAVGTAAYIAPEQVSGSEVTGAADVYALGLVLLEAITGRREYDGAPAEAALARLHRPPEIPPIDAGWRDLLGSMTALDPADRPGAAEVASMLRAGLTRPAPVGTAGVPDPLTSPILSEAAQGPATQRTGVTSQLTDPALVAAAQPRTSAIDRGGEALARQAKQLVDRLRALSAEAWGVIGALGALVALLVILGVAGGSDPGPEIPENTPAELREPLADLHIAVEGDGG